MKDALFPESPDRPVVLVTGASRGIGAATALAAARDGWTVVVNYLRNAEAAASVVDTIRAEGGTAHAIAADVSDEAGVTRMFAELDQVCGRLDALVNNAGLLGSAVSAFDLGEADLVPLFRANVFGLAACTREAVRRMSTQRGGRGGSIVNLSSLAARSGGQVGWAHYAATKGAVDSLTIAMARELGAHGVRINSVRPGLIATEIHDVRGGVAALQPVRAQIPLGRIGDAEDVAGTVTWLLSPRAAYVHGALIDVGGGR
jgi:NAD(P)-dependent dehydrogenase (short-subunit alcohol dehydrogenase family)